MKEKQEFSERLRAAMKARKLEVSGAVLEREFNLRWPGQPIRRQTAWKWLNGEAIPTQDKLLELAKWLRQDPHVLRFGGEVQAQLRATQKRWDDGAGYVERETFEAFLRLPAPQRKLVGEIIRAFAKAYAGEQAEG